MTLRNKIERDTHIRVIDQRIGVGVGGLDTVIRAYHPPSGLLVEVPRGNRNQYRDRQVALDMLEIALSSGFWPVEVEDKP